MKRSLRQWGWWLCVALVAGGVAREAFAGTMYRCTGSHGEIAITNKPAGYTACSKLNDYAEPAVKAHKPALKPEPAKMADSVKPDAPKAQASKADFADVVGGEAVRSDAAKPVLAAADAQAAESNAPITKPRDVTGPRPPLFSDVVSETRLNGELQVETVGSKTERSNPSPRFRLAKYVIYKVAHANGVDEYTNVPSGGASRTVFTTYVQRECFACDVKSTINFGALALITDAYKDEIAAAATESGVDQALLRAVIHAESAFNPYAVSVKGAQGLMQLMPATANDMGVASPFDPAQNIRGGARYLAGLLKLFNGDERLATAAYNSGPQNVQKYSGVPPFDETRVYVERVATLRKRYGEAH